MSTTTKKIETVGTIKREKYTVYLMTVADYCKAIPNLPTAQRVRGSVWSAEKSKKLVDDIKAGRYVPPIVLAGGAGKTDCADGQQRGLSIKAAYESGDLTGQELILIAIDGDRTFTECFYALNAGVPVGAGLVLASTYTPNVTAAVLDLASHPYFSGVKWTASQITRTAKCDMASSVLAICAGWEFPESSIKSCGAWLALNAAAVTPDAVKSAVSVLDGLDRAARPYAKVSKFKNDNGKQARKILSALRKKSLLMTAAACIDDGSDPVDVVAALGRDDLLTTTTYSVTTKKGDKRTLVAKWEIGGGTSGNNAEYVSRYHVLRRAASVVNDVPAPATRGDETDAEKAAVVTSADVIAATIGMGV